jgi:hypothetical protein
MTSTKKPLKLSKRVGLVSLISLVLAISSCIGCSINEHNRWGQSQNSVTFLFASGAYLCFAFFLLSGVLFIVVLAREE